MSASISATLFETYSATAQTTISGGSAIDSTHMESTITSTAPLTVVNHGKDLLPLGATAADDINLWPLGIEALTSGDVLHMRCIFHYGTTDTTKAQKAITLKNGATPDIVKTFGKAVELDFDAVTAVLATRTTTSNEIVRIERFWYIYTA